MLLYLFFDSVLYTFPKKMETEIWPKAVDRRLSPISSNYRKIEHSRQIYIKILSEEIYPYHSSKQIIESIESLSKYKSLSKCI